LQTCKNFSELAKRGYYNNVIFHRVIQVSAQRAFHRSTQAGVPHPFSPARLVTGLYGARR
jgi:cyclophilin family peptidyl-prolyl cis-trans isomerase